MYNIVVIRRQLSIYLFLYLFGGGHPNGCAPTHRCVCVLVYVHTLECIQEQANVYEQTFHFGNAVADSNASVSAFNQPIKLNEKKSLSICSCHQIINVVSK